jgi:AraC family transcriptional regulator of adaptative response/methylated-DNA-[protein]-cysteine methyltransferase
MQLAKLHDEFKTFWQAVLDRDASMDGRFVFAVESTGIFCRPSCPSRRPTRQKVSFFATIAEAIKAGYRACLRCHPDRLIVNEDRHRIAERACELLQEYTNGSSDRSPSLSELAEQVDVSPYQLHRAFKDVYGLTPKQYTESQRLSRFKESVRNSKTVTDALYEAGYGSSSRLYEKSSARLGMTPASYRKGGKGARIRYSIRPSRLGLLLTAATDRGLCAVRFGESKIKLTEELKKEFPHAEIIRDESSLADWTSLVQDFVQAKDGTKILPLDIQASAFEWKVWNHLRHLHAGETRTYGQIAKAIGQPTASRAVARACASNPVAVVIPCHRVVPAAGGTGGYRWGVDRKKKLLEIEARSKKS